MMLVLSSMLAYIFMSLPGYIASGFPAYMDIRNFLPVTLGLFWGHYGIIGGVIGSLLSSMVMRVPLAEALHEVAYIVVLGAGMWLGWHVFSKSHRVRLKTWRHYVRYFLLLAVVSGVCGLSGGAGVSAKYMLAGVLVGIPVNILFGSLLGVEPVLPPLCRPEYDAVFVLGSAGLEEANAMIEETAELHGVNIKRVFELQSCLEELTIRILEAIPDAEIHTRIIYGEAISARLEYAGKKYNPFMTAKGEDELDIMSLKIIKHRALRASFHHSKGKNYIHVVI